MYNEEKQGLVDYEVYENISKSQYIDPKSPGKTPKAIPPMCALFVENDKDVKSLRAKSRIVIIGNFKDRLYQKSPPYAPVLKYSFLRLLTAK